MDYTTLITTQHHKAPKFTALVALLTEAVQSITDCHATMAAAYDLDLAVGAQLDVIGLWVGVSRRVSVPFDNWFSFDVAGKGFDEGIWRGPFDPPAGLQDLDDTAYRRVLRAFIAAAHWDGTFWTYHAVLQKAMPPGNTVHVVDNFDMTVNIEVTGPPLSPLQEALLTGGSLTRLVPAGVRVAAYVLP